MQESRPIKKNSKKDNISGSDTILEMLRKKMPWILGNKVRRPKIKFPTVKRSRIIDRVTRMSTRSMIVLTIFVVLFILQTGVVYLIYRGTPAIGQGGNEEPMFLYPSIQDAFINESIVASLLMILNSSGYIFFYQASQHLYDRKMAVRYIIIGVLIILGTLAGLQAMITLKGGGEIFSV